MSQSAPRPLSLDEVRHVARLARLDLEEGDLESLREQLAAVLGHIDHLSEIDVTGVEPLAHPGDQVNRFRDDEVTEPLPVARLLELAPASEADCIAVPRVLGEA